MSMILRRDYNASIEDVWAACTEPDRLSRWFLKVSGDLRLGGTFALDGNAHGEILRCERPHLFVITWKYSDSPTARSAGLVAQEWVALARAEGLPLLAELPDRT
ncbi:SRPBCC domain-containing protein [Nonomuraea sp. K274]|uniref:SRPBCC domain-containing protein n=1 Tax=Nonomuraea cypriaca TaxID=1187855 RepID=A0A931A398_9ACTN|nr:SRPBCC domain-containing protein [Nonomuraea cypriaca]MBF8185456.1 SRPBCC domain-containing protein [Nonomuraea cypriaca]